MRFLNSRSMMPVECLLLTGTGLASGLASVLQRVKKAKTMAKSVKVTRYQYRNNVIIG
jgi:hypothetical protein